MEQGTTIREWVTQNAAKYGTNSEIASACNKELGVARKTVLNLLCEMKGRGKGKPVPSAEIRLGNLGLSEQEFRAKHDSLYKLEQAVKALAPGKFIPESEFRATVAIDPSKFRTKADLPQFDSYKGRVTGVTYWGHPKDIKRLKDEGVLQ